MPDILQADSRSFTAWAQQQMEMISKNWSEKTNPPKDHLRLVFVFDEVRATLRNKGLAFANLRRAAACFPEKCGITVVLIDTVSRVSNIVPVAESDPSTRVADKSNVLFPPIYLLPTMDVYACQIKEKVTTLQDMLRLNIFYQLGRPLWKTMIDMRDSTGKWMRGMV